MNIEYQTGSLFWTANVVGVSTDITPAKELIPGKLTDIAMASLRETFAGFKHIPSPAQWQGLRDLAGHLEAMANGTAEPLFYLSSLDPGVGKTQTIVHFVRALLASPEYDDISALICVGRLAEIKSFVDDMKLAKEHFTVLTSDDKMNALGSGDASYARVLFSTQQMLESRVKRHGSFNAVREFHYKGAPRQVRLWDETCLPARPVMLNVTNIEGMTREAQKLCPPLYTLLVDTIAKINAASDGDFVDVPSFEDNGVSLNTILGLYSDEQRHIRDAASDIVLLSGRIVIVRRDRSSNTFVHYENTLPDDLKPVVVCDASGRVRKTYPHWSKFRGDLVSLQHGYKDYSNLRLNIWRKGGSKQAWKENSQELTEGIIRTVNTKPNEEWLVIHHMYNDKYHRIDVPKLVKARAVSPDRLHFAHWGGEDYRATNKYKDIENVILAGTLFYEPSYYESVARLSGGFPDGSKMAKDDLKTIERGEHAHLILQALCRGSARKSEGGGCAPCDAYIIAHPRHGIPAMLTGGEIFPYAKCHDWSPIERHLKGYVAEAVSYAKEWFQNNPGKQLKMSQLRTAVGVSDHRDWNNDVVNHQEFEGALASHGILVDRRKGRSGSVLTNEGRF